MFWWPDHYLCLSVGLVLRSLEQGGESSRRKQVGSLLRRVRGRILGGQVQGARCGTLWKTLGLCDAARMPSVGQSKERHGTREERSRGLCSPSRRHSLGCLEGSEVWQASGLLPFLLLPYRWG